MRSWFSIRQLPASCGIIISKNSPFSAYKLVKQDDFNVVRIGNSIRVSKKSFDAWLDALEL